MERWKEGFIANAAPSDPHTFPFVCIGNKTDQAETNRQVPHAKGKAWVQENNMMFYETSAVEGVCVEEAFIEMAKAALKRESEQQIQMPASMNEASGALKLT